MYCYTFYPNSPGARLRTSRHRGDRGVTHINLHGNTVPYTQPCVVVFTYGITLFNKLILVVQKPIVQKPTDSKTNQSDMVHKCNRLEAKKKNEEHNMLNCTLFKPN